LDCGNYILVKLGGKKEMKGREREGRARERRGEERSGRRGEEKGGKERRRVVWDFSLLGL
jgi:hypothetical protein